jgi:PadR family transcriptional regulator PadR
MINSSFKKGSIEMLTLLMLQEGDIYGYQLIQMLAERSGDRITVQEGSLYPLLYRMQDAGYISGRDVTVTTQNGRKRSRVLYHLEPSGRERLTELKAEFDRVQQGIQSVFQNSVPIGYRRENGDE